MIGDDCRLDGIAVVVIAASTLAKAGYSVTAWSRTPREHAELTGVELQPITTPARAVGRNKCRATAEERVEYNVAAR